MAFCAGIGWGQGPVPLAREGRAVAQVVVNEDAGPVYRYAASELSRYLQLLSGGDYPVVSPAQAGRGPLLLVGGPEANRLTRELAARKLVDFSGLAKDGFLLWTVSQGPQASVILGGNDDAATLYAVYDFLERLGVTFLLTKDVLPARKPTLTVPPIQVRRQTPYPKRGLFQNHCYLSRSMMNLPEVKTMIDQMAKLKLNHLEIYWFEHEPWIDFGYRGEGKLLGDATTKETGFMAWKYHWGSHLVEDVPVGRDQFGGRTRLAPLEFHGVETPAQGFAAARRMLTETIRHAHARKIEVWLGVEPSVLPANLARFATRAPNFSHPFSAIHAVHMCPADPALHEMNENRLRALVETYPEADGYTLYLTENYPDCRGEADRALLLRERTQYTGIVEDWRRHYNNAYERNPAVLLDSTAGSVYVIRKMLEARGRIAPHARIAIGGIGRGFVLPALDQTLPKDIPFVDMESGALWTPAGLPLHLFGGMGERPRSLIHRLDDDAAMFGLQFNVGLYHRDRVLPDSMKHGLNGWLGQVNRLRGTEVNYRFLAEGSFQTDLQPRDFYAGYARRLFGAEAAPAMEKAFAALEANEEFLGWTGAYNFPCCSPIDEVVLAWQYARQPNHFDGPRDWYQFISDSHEQIRKFTRAAAYLGEALEALRAAGPQVAPHGREEFAYLLNKTESYRLLFQTLVALRQAYIAWDEAFRRRGAVAYPAFVDQLEAALGRFAEARALGRRATEHFAAIIDHPSDMGVLYRANISLVIGLELTEQTMANVVHFHRGRGYTAPPQWSRIFHEYPVFGRPGH
jgi:hypothetical protein